MSFSSDDAHGAEQRREQPYGAEQRGAEPRGTEPYGTERRGERPPEAGAPFSGILGTLSNAAWQVLVTTGLVAVALGVMVLAWPGATLAVLGALFGAYLLITGIFQLAGAFGAHVPGHLRVLSFISGALAVLLGLLCFRGPAQSILLLALWIGFSWLLRGVMMTAAAVSHEGMPARGWQIFLGVISMLGGIILIVAPFGSITALAVVAGIWLLALGVLEIFHGVQLRVELGHHAPGRAEHRPHFPGFRPHPQP